MNCDFCGAEYKDEQPFNGLVYGFGAGNYAGHVKYIHPFQNLDLLDGPTWCEPCEKKEKIFDGMEQFFYNRKKDAEDLESTQLHNLNP